MENMASKRCSVCSCVLVRRGRLLFCPNEECPGIRRVYTDIQGNERVIYRPVFYRLGTEPDPGEGSKETS